MTHNNQTTHTHTHAHTHTHNPKDGSRCDEDRVFGIGESVQIFQPLSLLHLGVEGKGGKVQQHQRLRQLAHFVDAVQKDEGPARVLVQKVVQIGVFVLGACVNLAQTKPFRQVHLPRFDLSLRRERWRGRGK